MLLFYIFILFLILKGISYKREGYHEDYLSKDKTNIIKGIFILMVFASHSLQYVSSSGYDFSATGDSILLYIRKMMGQLVVVMFLFYSGFGIGESYKRKGMDYVQRMPIRRIFGTIVNFDIAVAIFIIVDLIIGIHLSLKQCVLSLVAWEGVGNSNLYIFAILVCYIISYLVLRLVPNKYTVIAISLLIVLSSICISTVKQYWWYDTIWAFAFGFTFSYYKDKMERFLKNYYWYCLIVATVLFLGLFKLLNNNHQVTYNLLSISFASVVILISMKVSIDSKALKWFGKSLFPFYIYQRLPMLVFAKYTPPIVSEYPLAFMVLCFSITLVITFLYKYIQVSFK